MFLKPFNRDFGHHSLQAKPSQEKMCAAARLFQSELISKKGFTLLEVALGTTFAFAVTLIAIKMQTSGNTFIRAIEEELEIERTYIETRAQLSHKDVCFQNLQNKFAGDRFTANNPILNKQGKPLLAEGVSTFSKNVTITEASINADVNDPQKRNLKIIFTRISNPDPNTFLTTKERVIPLSTTLDPASGAIVACYADIDATLRAAMQTACQAIHGYFDGSSCQHFVYSETECPADQFLVGFQRNETNMTYEPICEELATTATASNQYLMTEFYNNQGNLSRGNVRQERLQWSLFGVSGSGASCPCTYLPDSANISIAGLSASCSC